MKITWVMGCNGVGKSTLMDTVDAGWEQYGTIQVGRMMRAKYPPDHFKGSNNPKHTADEAWQMLLDGLAAHYVSGKKHVFVDGQPRDVKQVQDCLRLWPDSNYLHLFASEESRSKRCEGRDGADPEKMKLAIARHESDMVNNYKVLCVLMEAGARITTNNTEFDLLSGYGEPRYHYFYNQIIREMVEMK